jgi:uncharacterized membrane protein YkvA (DUF1232 family)
VKKIERWKQRTKELKADTYALYLAAKDPRVPWYAKLLSALVVAYALSPIDLIPDFIPVLGYLDDLVLIPLGIALVIKLIPPSVLDECKEKARRRIDQAKSKTWVAVAFIIVIWVLLAAFLSRFLFKLFWVRWSI